jgi:hypothetical protein
VLAPQHLSYALESDIAYESFSHIAPARRCVALIRGHKYDVTVAFANTNLASAKMLLSVSDRRYNL